MDDKESLTKEYIESKNDVYGLLKKLNGFDGIKILLSFMETLYAEAINLMYNLETKKPQNRTLYLAMSHNISSHIHAIEELSGILLFSNREKTKLSRIPMISTFFTTNESDPGILDWLNKFDEEKDNIIITTMPLLEGPYKVKRFIWIKDYHVISGTEQIPILFNLFDSYTKFRSIRSILNQRIPAKISSKGKVLFHNPDLNSSLVREGMHPRKIIAKEQFPFWKDDILETEREGLISTELSRYALKQKKMQDLEHNRFFEQFIKIPEIFKIFEKAYGISLTKFRDITLAIKQIALSSDTSTVSILKPRLILKLKKLSNCSKTEIEKVLDLFILKPGDPIFSKCIFINGIECIYSWSLITFPLQNMMSEIYDQWYDGNKKGIEFEIDCREILRSESCVVLNDRLQIPPLNSDIDVIGKNGDILFVIECKSESRRKKRKTSQLYEFERYYKKLLKKTDWISNNFDIFSELLGNSNFLTQNVKTIVPLLVTRIMQLSPSIQSVSTSELKEIVSKIRSPENGFIEIILDSDVTIKIPALQVKNSMDI